MYKNVEVLDKLKHKDIKFDDVSLREVAKNIGSMPLGFEEVIELAPFCPVIISGDPKRLEFVAFCGLNSNISIFSKECSPIPQYAQTYPFLNLMVTDQKGNLQDLIGIDSDEVAKNGGEHKVFVNSGVSEIANKKIELVRKLNKERDISKKILQEFVKYDLLIEKDFKINFEDQEKVILDRFYIVDRNKLMKLDDATLALWAKKGWITLIDNHLKSLANFQKVIFS